MRDSQQVVEICVLGSGSKYSYNIYLGPNQHSLTKHSTGTDHTEVERAFRGLNRAAQKRM